MKERELRDLIADVRIGQLSRRAFVQRMIAVGLSAPMAGMMLSQAGVAMAAPAMTYKPTKAGGGGVLKLMYWQAPTLLNPHFAIGTKDQEVSRVFYEPLAGWDNDGNLVPVLAAEIPSKENDGLAEDGRSIIGIWLVDTAAARPMFGSKAPSRIRQGFHAVHCAQASWMWPASSAPEPPNS